MDRRHVIAAAATTPLVVVAPLVNVGPATARPATAVPAAAIASCASARVVVGPHGSDDAAGDAAHPLRTIEVAVRRLGAHGGTVLLRGGVYHQRVRLVGVPRHHGRPVPPRAPGPVRAGPDATGREATGMVEIANSSRDIAVRGLEITGYRTTQLDTVPIGIYVHGHDTSSRIVRQPRPRPGQRQRHPGQLRHQRPRHRGVRRRRRTRPITDLAIRGNEVDHLHLGASESVVVNGNVDRLADHRQPHPRQQQHRHRRDRLRADAVRPGTATPRVNRARHGVIAGNTVQPASAQPRQPGLLGRRTVWCNCADGIYIDGGTHIADRAQPGRRQRHRHRGRPPRTPGAAPTTSSWPATGSPAACSPASPPVATATVPTTAAACAPVLPRQHLHQELAARQQPPRRRLRPSCWSSTTHTATRSPTTR